MVASIPSIFFKHDTKQPDSTSANKHGILLTCVELIHSGREGGNGEAYSKWAKMCFPVWSRGDLTWKQSEMNTWVGILSKRKDTDLNTCFGLIQVDSGISTRYTISTCSTTSFKIQNIAAIIEPKLTVLALSRALTFHDGHDGNRAMILHTFIYIHNRQISKGKVWWTNNA